MKYLESKDLGQMFLMQESLNQQYMGKEWHKKWTTGQIKAALYCELGEFLVETAKDWKIWKADNQFDKNKAVYEFIDVLHFMLMAMLYDSDSEYLKAISCCGAHEEVRSTGDLYEDLFHNINRFLENLGTRYMYLTLYYMRSTVEIAAQILELEPGDIFKAYVAKNQVNLERAKGGADYDRSNEKQLTLD